MNTVDQIADNIENKGVPALTKAINLISNITIHTKIGDFIKQIQTDVNTIKTDISSVRTNAIKVNTGSVTDTTEEVEYYRCVKQLLVKPDSSIATV